MAALTVSAIAGKIRSLGLADSVTGVHSQLSSLGTVEPAELTADEIRLGIKPFAKTVLQGLREGLGDNGTLFVPTHSLCTMENGGHYRPEATPSTVGLFTETVRLHPQAVRSWHPTHSTAAIGLEACNLTQGHLPDSQPLGIQNALAKTVGLDGYILFIGATLKSNTMFHAYETLGLPALAPYFPAAVAAEYEGIKRLFAITWYPSMHRDFYAERIRETRIFPRLHKAGLIHEDRLGDGPIFFYKAKETARFFMENLLPEEPDILFCASPELCSKEQDCGNIRKLMQRHYSDGRGGWDPEKVRSGMDPLFLKLLKPGCHRVPLD